MSSRDAVSGSARPLVDYNPFDPAVIVDPVDYNALLRAEAPVHRNPHTGIFQIASYETVVEAVKQPEIFSNRFAVALRHTAWPYCKVVLQSRTANPFG